MVREELGNERTVGHVKAAVGWFGERLSEGNSFMKKSQIDLPEKHSPRTREVQMPEEESKLSNTKKMIRNLTSKIDESYSKISLHTQELEKQKHRKQGQEQSSFVVKSTDIFVLYAGVMKELKKVKQDLDKVKLEWGLILEEKKAAEEKAKDLDTRLNMYWKSVDELRVEIEEVNDEEVLVELAQIEARKEQADIEAQRELEAEKFTSEIEITKRKMKETLEEIDLAKELETKLAQTKTDIEMLENQIKMAKETDIMVSSLQKENEVDSSLVLKSVLEELELAKSELALIREEAFQLMTSMDVIRNEIIRISEKTAFMKKKDEKLDQKALNLDSKLLKAKEELEAVSSSEEKAKAIVDNLLLTCEYLKTELEASKKEKELICEKTNNLKAEIEINEAEKELAETKLEAAIQELEEVKSSELAALEKLKSLAEKAMVDRAFAAKHSSNITISKFEYEYLKSQAAEAGKIADKKVSAAHAWIKSLKANEKEIRMNIEIAQRKKSEENERFQRDRLVSGEIEGERDWDERSEVGGSEAGGELRRKSMKKSGGMTPGRRVKLLIPPSPKLRNSSKSFSANIKRREKIMPDLGKLFSKGVEGAR